MIRVLHVGKFCPPFKGGIESFVLDLSKALNSLGIKSDILCIGQKTADEHLIPVRNLFTLNSLPVSPGIVLKTLSLSERYDIIHIHSPNPLAEIASIFVKKPVVIHWHSDIVRQKFSYKIYKYVQKEALKRAKAVIATSPQYAESSLQIQPFKEKVRVIPLGVDPERFEEDYDERFSEFKKLVEGKKVVLSIGRLVEYKGFEFLIKSAKFLNPETVIVILGEGKLRKHLEDLIKRERLYGRVILFGKVENINPYMRICDVFCLPSITRSEAFGLVLVEALYFGKPLITTDVKGSGMSYVNLDGKTGFVVPPENPKAIAHAINRLLGNLNLYETFSRNALLRFGEFDIRNIAKRIEALYREVLK